MGIKYLCCAFLVGIFSSCNSPKSTGDLNDGDYLIFGHFYGRCIGKSCIEYFKLTDHGLFADALDDYDGEKFEFITLGKEQFEQAKDLTAMLPSQLLEEKETVIGCPDCADGGGLYIELSRKGTVRRWRVDQNKGNVPSYLHSFMNRVNATIEFLIVEK